MTTPGDSVTGERCVHSYAGEGRLLCNSTRVEHGTGTDIVSHEFEPAEPVPPVPEGERESRRQRGKRVREIWVAWARESPDPKPSWIAPWEDLPVMEQEVDMRIGDGLWGDGFAAGMDALGAAQNAAAERPAEGTERKDYSYGDRALDRMLGGAGTSDSDVRAEAVQVALEAQLFNTDEEERNARVFAIAQIEELVQRQRAEAVEAYLNRDYTDEAKARIDAATSEGLGELWSKPQ